MFYVGGTAKHTLKHTGKTRAVLSLRVSSAHGVWVQVWDAFRHLTDLCSVTDKAGDSCSSAETAWTAVPEAELQRETWNALESVWETNYCTDLKPCNSANGEMTDFWWIELGGSVSLVWRYWEQFSLEHSTQCRVQVMKGILKMGLLHFQEIKRVKHCTCCAPQTKASFSFTVCLCLFFAAH